MRAAIYQLKCTHNERQTERREEEEERRKGGLDLCDEEEGSDSQNELMFSEAAVENQ